LGGGGCADRGGSVGVDTRIDAIPTDPETPPAPTAPPSDGVDPGIDDPRGSTIPGFTTEADGAGKGQESRPWHRPGARSGERGDCHRCDSPFGIKIVLIPREALSWDMRMCAQSGKRV